MSSTWSISRTSAERIGEGVRPAEVVASEASLARLGLTSTVWEDLLLTLPAAFEATFAQHTKDLSTHATRDATAEAFPHTPADAASTWISFVLGLHKRARVHILASRCTRQRFHAEAT